ncbi:glutaredoxin family protein [Rhodococcus erythropolis]|uniref:glutaredoxin family protein n=1 Tax=Rhodococcus erythropolis TaxID=1833 RepID=UPI001BE4EF63|nr:glutaredoxin family protein [Rhodococcus erythropolis]MBT2266435.1 glutaredoxin family protein [Rhodococcus erythropolis]
MNVTVYSKANCPGCKFTMKKLDNNHTPYTVVKVDEDPAALALIQSWGFTSAPVVDAGGIRWAGFAPDKLNALKVAPAEREVHRSAGVEDRTDTEDKG